MMKTYLAPASTALARNIRKYGAISALAIGVIAVILLAQSQRPPSAQASGAASQQCVSPPGNMVRNGSFETPAGADLSVYIAPTSFEGWVVPSGSIDIVRGWQDADGEQSLDLAGYAPGVIYQDLCTMPGVSYQLSFAMAGNPSPGDPPTIKTMEVWWDDQLVDSPTFDITGHTGTSMGWQNHTYTVQAISSTTRLMFKDAYQGQSLGGPALDAVGVLANSPVPTPTVTAAPTLTPTAPTLTPLATATAPAAQNAVVYAPLIRKSEAKFPIAINDQAIAVRPIGALGEVYYSATLVLPRVLPSTGNYYLSASPDSVAPIKVDDELVVVLDGQDTYRLFLTYPRTVEVLPAEIARWAAADSIRVEFRDRYGSVVGSSPVWLIWRP
jgi:choice-of-anchor C domain-containing protein